MCSSDLGPRPRAHTDGHADADADGHADADADTATLPHSDSDRHGHAAGEQPDRPPAASAAERSRAYPDDTAGHTYAGAAYRDACAGYSISGNDGVLRRVVVTWG